MRVLSTGFIVDDLFTFTASHEVHKCERFFFVPAPNFIGMYGG